MAHWYEDFFGSDYLLRYPEDPASTALEVNSIIALLELEPPGRILDLACGYGRHALLLAERGFEVVGFDLSDDLLAEARRRALHRGLEIDFLQGDMRRLPFKAEFDAVINVFTSFGYFADAENRQVIEEAAKCLRPQGRLLIEMINRDGMLRSFQPTRWQELPEGFLLTETNFDPLTSRTAGRTVFISRSGQVHEYPLFTRAYSAHELRTILLESGLAEVDLYSTLDRSPFALSELRMVVLARKS